MEGDMGIILEDLQRMYADRTVWVIGGANIFRQALPFVEKLYLTTIPGKYECDVFLNKKEVDDFSKVLYNQTIDDTRFEIRSR
jgi:dihydrofolate reductase